MGNHVRTRGIGVDITTSERTSTTSAERSKPLERDIDALIKTKEFAELRRRIKGEPEVAEMLLTLKKYRCNHPDRELNVLHVQGLGETDGWDRTISYATKITTLYHQIRIQQKDVFAEHHPLSALYHKLIKP